MNRPEVFQGDDESWYWHLRDTGNGKIIATGGEGFTREDDAWKACRNALEPEPSTRALVFDVGDLLKGGGWTQALVTLYPESPAEIAFRPNRHLSWGPPQEAHEDRTVPAGRRTE